MTTTRVTRPTHAPMEPPPRGGRARWWILALLALAVVGVLVALVVTSDDEETAPTTTGSTATSAATTETTATTAPAIDRSSAVWPAEGSGLAYTDPVAATRAFAEDFLGFQDPVVGDLRQGDSRSGEVDVQPSATGPVTTVLVRQLSGEATWSVLGAGTELIQVTEPAAGDTITSPVQVRGSALAFEGNVQVDVRQDGRSEPLGSGFVTGGGDIVRPFEGRIEYGIPIAERGALVFFTTSAEDGRMWSATVLRVTFQTTGAGTEACGNYQPVRETPGPGDMEVTIFFHCDAIGEDALVAVYRHVAESPGVLRASLLALLAGPNSAEQAAPISTWFSTATAGMLNGVTLDAGHAIVDFDRDLATTIPNASTSAGSARLLAELDATVFQFPTVTSVEYRLDGDCEAFSEWLQYGGCEPRTRASS